MKAKEYKNNSISELQKIVLEKKEALREFRFGTAGAKTKNVKAGKSLRKDIARAMTAISEKNNKI